jgi:hypothetical protein
MDIDPNNTGLTGLGAALVAALLALVKFRPWLRSEKQADATANIGIVMQQGQLEEIARLQGLAAQLAPTQNRLLKLEARISALGVLLGTVKHCLCQDCLKHNRSLIELITIQLEHMLRPDNEEPPHSDTDIRIPDAGEIAAALMGADNYHRAACGKTEESGKP